MIIRKVKVTEYEYQAPINYVAGATEPDIQFQLTDYEIPSGATGRVYVGRSDGTFEYTVATISGNTVTVAPTSSMFSVKGPGAIQVTMYVGNEVVKNFAVPVYVHADLADDSAEAGSDVTGVFRAAEEQALADFQEQAEEIAEEVKESIPEDYTELTEEVSELNERLGNAEEELPTIFSNDAKELLLSILENSLYKQDITDMLENLRGKLDLLLKIRITDIVNGYTAKPSNPYYSEASDRATHINKPYYSIVGGKVYHVSCDVSHYTNLAPSLRFFNQTAIDVIDAEETWTDIDTVGTPWMENSFDLLVPSVVNEEEVKGFYIAFKSGNTDFDSETIKWAELDEVSNPNLNTVAKLLVKDDFIHASFLNQYPYKSGEFVASNRIVYKYDYIPVLAGGRYNIQYRMVGNTANVGTGVRFYNDIGVRKMKNHENIVQNEDFVFAGWDASTYSGSDTYVVPNTVNGRPTTHMSIILHQANDVDFDQSAYVNRVVIIYLGSNE